MIKEILKLSDEFESYSFEEKKDVIHIIENSLRSGEFDIELNEVDRFKFNKNILNRIIYYLTYEYYSKVNIKDDIRNVEIEFEKINAAEIQKSLTPLHYSIRLIKSNIKSNPKNIYEDEIFNRILIFLEGNANIDKGNQIKNNLKFIINVNNREKSLEKEELGEIFKNAKKLIANAEIFISIRFLLDSLNPYPIQLVQLSSRLNFSRKENIMGTLSQVEYGIEVNKISRDLLQLIEIFEDEYKT
jgi:hypothetical protein